MTINRVTTYANHQQTLRDFTNVQSRLADLQNQISSGYKSDDYKGLDGQVELFSSLEAKIAKAKSFQENNTLITSRLQATSKAMDSLTDTADAMENLIVNRRSGAGGQALQFTQQMQSLLAQFTSGLNSNVEGRFLFAGSATSEKPVKTDPIPSPLVEGTPDAGYYHGSNSDLTARIDDYMDITYNVRADHPAFQKIMAAADLAMKADAGNNDEKFASAIDMMQAGMKELSAAQAKVNANIVAVEQVSDRQESMQLYWKGLSEQIAKTDIVSASTQVAIDQSVLTATFQVFSSINQLRLSDFLR